MPDPTVPQSQQPLIFATAINNFHYLYQDAEYLHGLAKKPEMQETFEKTRLCRTAIVLYIVSLEALINQAMEAFLPAHVREFFVTREKKFETRDKWRLVPLLSGTKGAFDEGAYPWSHFSELVDVRNDYLHPKHQRMAYYRLIAQNQMEPLDFDKIPEGFPAKERDLVYRQTRVTRDPYSVLPHHIDTVKKVVDETIKELDRLLDGKITEKWLHEDSLNLMWPPGAKLG